VDTQTNPDHQLTPCAPVDTAAPVALTADAAFQALCNSLLVSSDGGSGDTNVSSAAIPSSVDRSRAGLLFEQVARAYLLLHPDYAHDDVKVERFPDWARANPSWTASSADNGIDLIMTTRNHELPLPIQVKFSTFDGDSLSRRKLDALTAETRVPGRVGLFEKPMIITNASSFSSKARDRIAAEGFIAHGEAWFVAANQTLIEGDMVPPVTLPELLELVKCLEVKTDGAILTPHVPRAHQYAALEHTQRVLETSNCTTAHLACGTGKTLIAWMLFSARVQPGQSGVVFVPALSLVRSTIDAFRRQSTLEERYEILAVCSDATVSGGRRREESGEIDIDINDLGTSKVTSEPAVIKDWLAKPSKNRKLVVATYHSSDRVREAAEAVRHGFSVLIGDEAHRLVGEGVFGDPIWQVPTEKSVFLTATPHVSVASTKKSDGEEVVSIPTMSDASKFGDEKDWFTYSTTQGIEDDILAPYQVSVYVTRADDPHLDDYAVIADAVNAGSDVLKVGAHSQAKYETTASMAITGKKCASTMRDQRGGHGISMVFSSSIRDSKAFVDYMHRYHPGVPAEHVDGTMNTDDREKAKNRVVLSGGVLSNVRVLNEGVDIPQLGVVVFATPKNSKVDIVQGVGRVLRKDPHNPGKVGEIVIPIVLPAGASDEDANSLVENSAFAPLWATLRAVVDNDDTIMRMLTVLKNPSLAGTLTGKDGERYPSVDEAKLRYDQLVRIDTSSYRMNTSLMGDTDLLERFTDSISTRMLRSIDGGWTSNYAATRAYMEEHGKTPSTENEDPVVISLGEWCQGQRSRKKRGVLSSERIVRLESIPGWVWDYQQHVWDQAFRATIDYVDRCDELPHKNDSNPAVKRLGLWVAAQCARQNRGVLIPERARRLESIPGWIWSMNQDVWDEAFSLTMEYMSTWGKPPSMKSDNPNAKRIGRWINVQRAERSRGNLSPARTQLLESIPGWVWNQQKWAWEEYFSAISLYLKDHGMTMPSVKNEDHLETKGLIQWVRTQRSMKRRGILKTERESRLGSLPGWTWDHQPQEAR